MKSSETAEISVPDYEMLSAGRESFLFPRTISWGFLKAPAIIIAFTSVLLIDIEGKSHSQPLANVVMWLLFALFMLNENKSGVIVMFTCLILATLGEMFFSLVWGLYEYRLPGIPLFVPPGHVLLFMTGSKVAARVSDRIIYYVPFVFIVYTIAGVIRGFDTFALILLLYFLACYQKVEARKLYSTMFLLSFILELVGTQLGNWRWFSDVPVMNLTTISPPPGAGVMYCMLDLMVMGVLALLLRRFKNLPLPKFLRQ